MNTVKPLIEPLVPGMPDIVAANYEAKLVNWYLCQYRTE